MLKRMADYLSQAQRFSVTADIGFDVVQDSGEKIEFGETRKIIVRRPDQARIDITKRDGGVSGFVFDGKEISVLLDLPWFFQDIVVLPDGPAGAIISRTLPAPGRRDGRWLISRQLPSHSTFPM